MDIQKIEATQELPATDQLFLVDGSTYIRARVILCNTLPEVLSDMPEEGCHEEITVSVQCSLAKDSTGDVVEDQGENHLILAKEHHSVAVDNLIQQMDTYDGWLAGKLTQCVEKAARKAFIITSILRVTEQA